MTCELSRRCSPRWLWGCLKAPLYSLTLDSSGDGAELMREERSLVHVPLYPALGEAADTERTLEVRWRSILQADVETSVHLCLALLLLLTTSCESPLCWPCDLFLAKKQTKKKNIHSEYSGTLHGCVLTLAWRYWLMAFRSISPHTLSPTDRCFKAWNKHKSNWQRRTQADISVIPTLQKFGILSQV